MSHALVTHYFGTYDGLVEATMERRFHRLRDALVPRLLQAFAENAPPRALLATYRSEIAKAASDATMMRLAVWAATSGRASAADFFPRRVQGLKLLTDTLAVRSRARREDLELALVTSFALAITWKVAGRALAGALGKAHSESLDAWFESRTADMLDAFLERSARSKGSSSMRNAPSAARSKGRAR